MSRSVTLAAVAVLALALAGCASSSGPSIFSGAPAEAPPPAAANAPPAPGIPAADLIGRWGFASYHREADRARTTAQARTQCSHPYVINRAPGGGVMMHLADQQQPVEMVTKGGPDGKRYIGPPGPAGDTNDREIVSFDGRVMILKWLDPEVASRYGISVYVRCGARG
jgi:hypothetical protein